MTASELLSQVRHELEQMPTSERGAFFDGLFDLEIEVEQKADGQSPFVNWSSHFETMKEVWGDNVLPENIVLAAREEEEH
jgi:hypothetical protein